MMSPEQIIEVLASDDPVQLKRLIALLGWHGTALLGGMEMRSAAADPNWPNRAELMVAAKKIYLTATPVFETVSDMVRPTAKECDALGDQVDNAQIDLQPASALRLVKVGNHEHDAVTEASCSKHVAWRMMSGDWRDELVSIHGPDGLIASGLTVNQATAIIAAHGGVSDSSQQGGAA